ncbi:MAG: PAS domain S-box protein [Humidesulfovibrio sp.]|nr:PAS domain S-box protein [Humidesulfovibrio sp.]
MTMQSAHPREDRAANGPIMTVRASLTLRLLKRILLFCVAFTLLLAGWRVWWEYHAAMQSVQELLTVIGNTTTKGLAASLWDFNNPQIKLEVEGITNFRYIRYAAVNDTFGVLVTSGRRAGKDVLDREYPLVVFRDGKPATVGALHVQVDLAQVDRQALKTGLEGLLSNAGLLLLVAALVFWLTNTLVSRHLAAIAAHFQSFNLSGRSLPLTLDRPFMGDELDVLTQAVNTMQKGLAAFYGQVMEAQKALSETSERYHALFGSVSDPVLVVDRDTGLLVECNEAAERFFDRTREQFLGLPLRALHPSGASLMDDLSEASSDDAARAASPREVSLLAAGGEVKLAAMQRSLFELDGQRLVLGVFRDITERKALEQLLAEQLTFQQTLLDTIPYAVFYKGRDTRFLGCNKAYEACFGVRREDFVGRRVLDLEYLPMEDRRNYQAEDEGVIASVGRVQKEMPIPFADGVVHQTLYSVTGFRLMDGAPGGLIGVIVDITDRKQAEEDLRQSEEKFSRIFEMAPESITFVRLSDSVRIAANAAFETVTGYSREEAIGASVQELVTWDDAAAREEFLRRLGEDGSVKDFEFLLRRADGALRRVVSSAKLVTIAGEQCYVSITHDITDERRMQELLIQSEKMMSVGSLAAGIAHEINNPLGIMHQAVQNLIQRTSPDQKKNQETAASLGLDMDLLQRYVKARKLDVFLEDIQVAAQRASGIIRNMLNFSRRSESKCTVCDLGHIIEQAVFLASSDYDLKKSYDFKRIEISLDLETHLSACLCTETEIEQVLLNLLRNAAQAMSMCQPPTPDPRIGIRLRAGEGCVRIEVADNGPGMEPETQRKAFEPFYTTKPPGIGTGLGLSVSYFIITKGHGGRMWLDSLPGRGTTFFIELPAKKLEAPHA